jgi:divalent metal cation (Fe/Co/Zn/Cd) transporter
MVSVSTQIPTTSPGRSAATLGQAMLVIHCSVVCSYFGKAVTKAIAGVLLGSPPLINDAIHGFLDIGEHVLIAVVGRTARKAEEARFPLGRKPLLDVVGFVIGLSVAGLGLKCLRDGLVASLRALELTVGIFQYFPSAWIRHLPDPPDYSIASKAWVAGSIFTACAIVSFVVYWLEYRLAERHRLKEYKDDAVELRQDAVLELATGSCLLMAWVVAFSLERWSGIPDSFPKVNAYASGLVLLGLSAYLLFHAYHAIKENVCNLLHPGLDMDAVERLKSHLAAALPDGCALISRDETDLIAYTTGEVLHVTGLIGMPRAQMAAADLILDRASYVTATFLADRAEEIKVRFFPLPGAWSFADVEAEWRRLLVDIWQIDPRGVSWPCFVALKKGDLSEALQLATRTLQGATPKEAIALVWMRAAAALYAGEDKNQPANNFSATLDALAQDDPRRLAFLTQEVLSSVVTGVIHDPVATRSGIDDRVEQLRSILDGSTTGYPPVLLAETAFVLGLLAERQDRFDLQLSERRYRQALGLYLGSGFPLESDRLLNTWGHQKSLLYEIEEATHLLERSRSIKEIKGDELGLSFTLGCLGDNLRRAGDFAAAVSYYKRDLGILDSLGVDHARDSVICKLGESEVACGFVEGNAILLDCGIARMESVLYNAASASSLGFFARKGLAKGIIWKALMPNNQDSTSLFARAEQVLAETESFSPYANAHANRLRGRLARVTRNYNTATQLLTDARDGFASMCSGTEFRTASMQSLCCGVEIALSQADMRKAQTALHRACAQLQLYLQGMGGLLGATRYRMDAHIDAILDRRTHVSDANAHANHLIALIEG